MGPQLYRCGNVTLAGFGGGLYICFNGAATLSLRKCPRCTGAICRSGGLQWGRNFIVAEITTCMTKAYCHSQLQWGRNFIVAEMMVRVVSNMLMAISFNGAATLSLRKSEQATAKAAGSHSFNGAATLSLRKSAEIWWRYGMLNLLQWGRNFIVAEISSEHKCKNLFCLLQWGRNFIVAEIAGCVCRVCQVRLASMGPQLYRCGNIISSSHSAISHFSLQWGRNFIVAEIGLIPLILRQTTMLQWGRNFIVAEIRTPHNAKPHHEKRFNGAATLSLRKCDIDIDSLDGLELLQWGRNFIVAEI